MWLREIIFTCIHSCQHTHTHLAGHQRVADRAGFRCKAWCTRRGLSRQAQVSYYLPISWGSHGVIRALVNTTCDYEYAASASFIFCLHPYRKWFFQNVTVSLLAGHARELSFPLHGLLPLDGALFGIDNDCLMCLWVRDLQLENACHAFSSCKNALAFSCSSYSFCSPACNQRHSASREWQKINETVHRFCYLGIPSKH